VKGLKLTQKETRHVNRDTHFVGTDLEQVNSPMADLGRLRTPLLRSAIVRVAQLAKVAPDCFSGMTTGGWNVAGFEPLVGLGQKDGRGTNWHWNALTTEKPKP
jgi:hypothetical protein